jgi:hypothetical protein
LLGDLDRLHDLTLRLNDVPHPSCVGPHTALRHEDQLVAISRFVPGLHLGELLVRRGRFPAGIVVEIGRQLLDGLAALEHNGIVHGNIRMSNVRLTTPGVAVLVDAGIRPAISPELTILARVPPDRYDGMAPELIGTGASPTPQSDLYALGCLLWHLLAGRPPFPTGDPLAKLAAHQTRPITDIREWAPDTPADLADRIAAFTAVDVHDRPASCRDALQNWGPPRRSGRKKLARFRALFNSAAPRAAVENGSSMSWGVVLVLLFVLSGAMLTLFDKGARNELLRLGTAAINRTRGGGDLTAARPSKPETTEVGPQDAGGENGGALAELPPPDADGVIVLDSSRAYRAAVELAAIGRLTLRGTGATVATVLIADKPLRLWAEEVVLDNVTFARAADSTAEPRALVLVETQNLVVSNCRFETHSLEAVRDAKSPASDTVAIAWNVLDRLQTSAAQVHLEDSVFVGTRSAVFLKGLPRQLQCQNCLKLGGGPFLTLAGAPTASTDLRMQLFWQPVTTATAGRIDIEANDCVLDVAGENAALFQLAGSQIVPESLKVLEMFGEGTLTNSGVTVARRRGADGKWQAVDDSHMKIDGLLATEYEFAGELSGDPRDSLIKSHNAPTRHEQPPGIDVEARAGG